MSRPDGAAEPPEPPELVEVGRVLKPHGLRGQVLVDLITDRDERVGPGARLHSDAGTLVVASSRRQPKRAGHRPHNQWVVAFEGYDDRDRVDALRGLVLRAEPIDDPDELWVDDLVGAEVVLQSTGAPVGTCVALVANPASDLIELDGGALVPVVFVTGHTAGRVVIDPPDGLFDL